MDVLSNSLKSNSVNFSEDEKSNDNTSKDKKSDDNHNDASDNSENENNEEQDDDSSIDEHGIKMKMVGVSFRPVTYPKYLEKFIPENDFINIIQTLNDNNIKSYYNSKKEKSEGLYPFVSYCLIFISILTIGLGVVNYIDSIAFFGTIFLIVIITVLFIISIIYVYKKKIYHLSKSDVYLKNDIEQYLGKLNKEGKYPLIWSYDAFERTIIIKPKEKLHQD